MTIKSILARLEALESEAQEAVTSLTSIESQIRTIRYLLDKEMEVTEKSEPIAAAKEPTPIAAVKKPTPIAAVKKPTPIVKGIPAVEVNMRQIAALEAYLELDRYSLQDPCSDHERTRVVADAQSSDDPSVTITRATNDCRAIPYDVVVDQLRTATNNLLAEELLGWLVGISEPDDDTKIAWLGHEKRRVKSKLWSVVEPAYLAALETLEGPGRVELYLQSLALPELKKVASVYLMPPPSGNKGQRLTWITAITAYLEKHPYHPALWFRSPHQDLINGPTKDYNWLGTPVTDADTEVTQEQKPTSDEDVNRALRRTAWENYKATTPKPHMSWTDWVLDYDYRNGHKRTAPPPIVDSLKATKGTAKVPHPQHLDDSTWVDVPAYLYRNRYAVVKTGQLGNFAWQLLRMDINHCTYALLRRYNSQLYAGYYRTKKQAEQAIMALESLGITIPSSPEENEALQVELGTSLYNQHLDTIFDALVSPHRC